MRITRAPSASSRYAADPEKSFIGHGGASCFFDTGMIGFQAGDVRLPLAHELAQVCLVVELTIFLWVRLRGPTEVHDHWGGGELFTFSQWQLTSCPFAQPEIIVHCPA